MAPDYKEGSASRVHRADNRAASGDERRIERAHHDAGAHARRGSSGRIMMTARMLGVYCLRPGSRPEAFPYS